MAEAFVLHEGAFGRISLLSLRSGLVAHSHSDAHIVWWLGGADAEARIGTQVFRYSEAQACAVNPYEQHDLKLLSTDVPALFFAGYIRKDWLEKRAHASGGPFLFPSPRIAISPELRARLWQLLDLMMFRPKQHELLNAAVQELITGSVHASLIAKSPAAKPIAGPLLSHKLRLAAGLMRERADIRPTIDEIATEAGLSRARLFALFRNQLNTTPQVFWSAIRLEKAIREVRNGDVPLVSVAHELGFSSASNFSRFFKEHTGVSPSDYRRAANAASVQPSTGLPL